MKLLILGTLAFLAVSNPAWAQESTIDDMGKAVVEALKLFQQDEPTKAQDFSGVKAWIDGGQFQVKIYLQPASEFIQYTCFKHVMGGEEMIMCDKVD
jgi:hypothetical protein